MRFRFRTYVATASAVVMACGAALVLVAPAASASTDFTAFTAPISGATDFATNFPNSAIGPMGIVQDGTNFFAYDLSNHTLYRFPATGGDAATATSAVEPFNAAIGIAGGVYYGSSGFGARTFNPTTLAAGPLLNFTLGCTSNAIIADPLSTSIFMSSFCGIYRIDNPLSASPTVTQISPTQDFYDGLTISADGQHLWTADYFHQNVVELSRTGTLEKTVFVGTYADGLAVARNKAFVGGINVSGNVFVNDNDGTVKRIDTNSGNAVSTVAAGGTRGDLATVGPDGCLYVTQVDRVEKLAPCFFQTPTKGPVCVIHSNPSQTESGLGPQQHSSIADIIQVSCKPIYSESTVTIDATQLSNACQGTLSWASPPFGPGNEHASQYTVTLDNDGNAIAALWGGPSCAPSTNRISASLNAPPFTTVATSFTILPPANTAPGVTANPTSIVEDSVYSAVATVIQVELPSVYAEKFVTIKSDELYTRCNNSLSWWGPEEAPLGTGVAEVTVQLDNNGNAFVVAIGGPSCASGTSTITADLTTVPYTTKVGHFTILSPRPTI